MYKPNYFHQKLSFKKGESTYSGVRFWEKCSKPHIFLTGVGIEIYPKKSFKDGQSLDGVEVFARCAEIKRTAIWKSGNLCMSSWDKEAWMSIPWEMIVKSFKNCFISNTMNGTEDDYIYESKVDIHHILSRFLWRSSNGTGRYRFFFFEIQIAITNVKDSFHVS